MTTTLLSPKTTTRTSPSAAVPAARRGGLTLEIIRDVAGFHALQPFWDVLVGQMHTRSPFLRWDWMRLWWDECRQEARLAIAVLRDAEGVPHAIAPLMLARESDPARKHLVTLTWLAGFGEAHGERLDLIVPAGQEKELTPQLCRVFKMLRKECDNVRLNHLPEESPNTQLILEALTAAYSRAGILNRQTCRFINLPRSWEEYEARHNSKWRNVLRRRRRAFTTEHAGTATLAGERVTLAEAMKELRVLHAMQWPSGISSFTTDASWRFHQRLAEIWVPQQRAWMPVLEADGKVIAILYGFMERDEFFQYQTGWEQSLSKISPGKLVMRWAIDCSMQRGLRVYDMLPSDYEYKRQWADGARWLLDLEAFSPTSWRATVFRTLRAMRRLLPSRRTTEESGTSPQGPEAAHCPAE
ncbi:GNAT family N-acetyltransferase [Prosthecobacter sp.]|uniref:GNAT family N-acetyltransferase n=1 Tax=Prosthecobacter sp. TaxID=1965333 RepID=UPI0037844316